MSYLMSNYTPLAVTFIKGSGCHLTDDKGETYLDALCGVGVTGLGHAHPEISKAIQSQSQQLLHTSNWYHIQHQETLAEELCKLANMDGVFFGNSGAEANEGAIKTKFSWPYYGHPVSYWKSKSSGWVCTFG